VTKLFSAQKKKRKEANEQFLLTKKRNKPFLDSKRGEKKRTSERFLRQKKQTHSSLEKRKE
jgi:hypothetical protein